MKNKKKLLFFVLIFISCLTLNLKSVSADELSVNSEKITQEKETIAKNNWENYLQNFLIESGKPLSDFYLGSGFSVDNKEKESVVVFPIIEKETLNIMYALQIDSGNHLLLSKKLGEKLNEVSVNVDTSQDNPVTISSNEQTYFYNLKDMHKQTLIGKDSPNKSIQSDLKSNQIVIEITSPIAQPKVSKRQTRTTFDHVLLPWKVYEIQYEKPWCYYYTIAAVINNQEGKKVTLAEEIIKGVYPNATEQQLTDVEWIVSGKLNDAFEYLKKKYNRDVRLTDNMTFSNVKKELKRNAGLIVNLNNKDKTSYGHSICLVGYTNLNSSTSPYYYYWNPWWEDTFVVSSEATYMKLGQNDYKWSSVIYNF